MLGRQTAKCCGPTRQSSSLARAPVNVFDLYHYLKRAQIRRNYALATRCTAVSGMDLFCEESNEGEIDDLLAFKKVFEDEIQFVEIDVGVKGSLHMHYDNQTLSEVVLL